MDRILIVDDEPHIRTLLVRTLAGERVDLHTAASGAEALEARERIEPDVVLLDLRLPDMSGLDVLRAIRAASSETAVIIITAFGKIETAVEAMRAGAFDYLVKPFDHLEPVRRAVDRVLEHVRAHREVRRLRESQDGYRLEHLVGESPSIRRLRATVRQIAEANVGTVLVTGESGTGKELVAKGLHHCGPRSAGPFVEVNCAAIADTLFESELFGHEKGAFSDARATKQGLMEVADGGTLFLDEVGELSQASQAKLLRALQERSIRRVGGVRDIKVDVNVVAATNRSLEEAVRRGTFREDLFYRLHVVPIEVPALRERGDDVVRLANHFLSLTNRGFHTTIVGFTAQAEELLLGHAWPGNVRELRNIVERAAIMAPHAGIIDAAHLGSMLTSPPEAEPTAAPMPVFSSLEEVERRHIEQVLAAVRGNKSEAARVLGITRLTLRRKLATACAS